MNERYKELEKQCTKQQIDYDVGKMYDQVDHRKLAELIIEDACRALNPMLRDMISRGQAVDLIRQHFGVGK